MPIHDLETLRAQRETILQIAARNGATNVRVFGSVVRGEADETSDVDLLVHMEAGRSLLDLVGFEQDLEEQFGQDFDVVSDGGLSPYIGPYILAESVSL